MLSVLAQRVALRAPAQAVLRSRAWPVAQHAWARTFIATPFLAFPSTAKSAEPATTKTALKKSKEPASDKPKKKATKDTPKILSADAPKKRGRPRKEQVEAISKLSKIPADLLPPKRPPAPFAAFVVKYNQARSMPGGPRGTKEAAQAWKALSPAEKQAFTDEYRVANEEWQKRLQEYYERVGPATFKAVNKQRVAQGRSRVKTVAMKDKKHPPTPFIQFFNDYRRDNNILGSSRYFSKEVGERWRAMSDEEKAPYFEAWRAEKEEFAARRKAAEAAAHA